LLPLAFGAGWIARGYSWSSELEREASRLASENAGVYIPGLGVIELMGPAVEDRKAQQKIEQFKDRLEAMFDAAEEGPTR
jgi:hypothetical protein